MGMTIRPLICHPGHGASCALCCGSHNYRASRREMDALFRRRAEAASSRTEGGHGLPGSAGNQGYGKIYSDGNQCPWVGFVDPGCTLIGCLLYPAGGRPDLRHIPFPDHTCRNFSCMAGELLADEEIAFAAELAGDWYYYGLLVNEIDLLRKARLEFGNPGNVPPGVLEELKNSLERSASGSYIKGA